ncbi:MAG: CheF family chemotaxis protein [Archaeoglobaceae archaeon]
MTESKITDNIGKFISPISSNDKRYRDAKWVPGRIILSTKNIWMIGKDRKKKIPLKSIYDVGGRFDISNEVRSMPFYILIKHYGSEKEMNSSLVTLKNKNEFENLKEKLLEILLNKKVVLVKYPVKKGGVIQQNIKWEKAQIAIKKNKLRMVTESKKFIRVDLDKIQLVKKEDREIDQETKKVLDIQFSEMENEQEFSVECYVHGKEGVLNILNNFIFGSFDKVTADINLSESEKQIIMSLYTGVSPFEIAGFIGMDVDKVEEVYDRLIELGVLKEVRKRKEVILTTRGKNLASEALSE